MKDLKDIAKSGIEINAFGQYAEFYLDELKQLILEREKEVLNKLCVGEKINYAELNDRLKKHPKYPGYDSYSIEYLAGRVREATLTVRALNEQLKSITNKEEK